MRLWSLVDARKLPMASAASRPNVVTACKGGQGGCRVGQGRLVWRSLFCLPSLAHPRRKQPCTHGSTNPQPICPTCNHTHTHTTFAITHPQMHPHVPIRTRTPPHTHTNNICNHTPTHAPASDNSHPHTHTCTHDFLHACPSTLHLQQSKPRQRARFGWARPLRPASHICTHQALPRLHAGRSRHFT